MQAVQFHVKFFKSYLYSFKFHYKHFRLATYSIRRYLKWVSLELLVFLTRFHGKIRSAHMCSCWRFFVRLSTAPLVANFDPTTPLEIFTFRLKSKCTSTSSVLYQLWQLWSTFTGNLTNPLENLLEIKVVCRVEVKVLERD